MTQACRAKTRIAALTAVVFMAYTAPCHAYIDPGTGSIILQSILAGIAVAAGLLRLYWHRFRTFLSSLVGDSGSAKPGDEETAGSDVDVGDKS